MTRILALAATIAALVAPAQAYELECEWTGFGKLGCKSTTPPPIYKASFCDVMQRATGGPFRWAREDTRQTKEQADKINAAGKVLCRWGKR